MIIVSLLAMICKSVIDFLSKLSASHSKGKNVNKFYLLETITVVVLLLILWALGLTTVQFDSTSIFYGVLIGVFSFVSYFLFLLSLKDENGSVNITIYRLNFIVSGVMAIILFNEAITFGKVLGITFCAAALMLFINMKGISVKNNTALVYSILGCVSAGVMNVFNKLALNVGVGSNTILFFRYITVLLITVVYYRLINTDMKIDIRNSRQLITLSTICGGLMLLSLNLLYYALKIGDVSIVTPIVQSCFVFTSVLCFVFLKEKLSVKKIIGVFFAVVSIVIIGL